MSEEGKKLINQLLGRVKGFESEGLEFFHALNLADLENRIESWPKGWGDDFVVWIYGDFKPLTEKIKIENLEITIESDVNKKFVISKTYTAHRAIVKISDKSIGSIIDAIKRINILLGAFSLVSWGNTHCNWWCYLTHEFDGSVISDFKSQEIKTAVDGILSMDPELRRKIDSALYWLRNSKESMFNENNSTLLKRYAAQWNVFECLVEAVNIIKPIKKISKTQKQNLLNQLLEKYENNVNVAFIQEAYHRIVNPGLKMRAEHALGVCFGDSSEYYVIECFNRPDKNNRLYDIRNAINHGDIDAENPGESARIRSRLRTLEILNLGIFGRLVPFSYPIDRSLKNSGQMVNKGNE